MTPLEIVAFVFAVLVIIKVLFRLIAPSTVKKIAEWFLTKKNALTVMAVIALLSFAGLLYLFLKEMTITEVFGGMCLMALVYAFLFYTAFRELLRKMIPKILDNNVYIILTYLIFLAMAVYVIVTLV